MDPTTQAVVDELHARFRERITELDTAPDYQSTCNTFAADVLGVAEAMDIDYMQASNALLVYVRAVLWPFIQKANGQPALVPIGTVYDTLVYSIVALRDAAEMRT